MSNTSDFGDLQKIFDNSYEKFGPDIKQTYYKKYGIDFIFMLIIIVIFIIFIMRFYLLNKIPVILANWSENECNPEYMKDVHIINPDKNKTSNEQSKDQFKYCIKKALRPVAADSFKPIYYSLDVLTKSYDELASSMTDIKGDFSNIRANTTDITENINSKTLDVAIEQEKNILTIKNMMQTLQAGIIGSLYVQKYILQSFISIFNVKM